MSEYDNPSDSKAPEQPAPTSPHTEPALSHVDRPELPDPLSYPELTPPHAKKRGMFGVVRVIVVFVLLFCIGIVLSMILRQALPSGEVGEMITPTPSFSIEPTLAESSASGSPVINQTGLYKVLNSSRQPIEGLALSLPSAVATLECDGTNCASQGADLPGGTRFTVAPRGKGQQLSDFRGRIVSDLSGRAFKVKEVTIAQRPAIEFEGTFSGATATGFGFSQMHGVMIAITDDLSLELNHFTPVGKTVDFAADKILFGQILSGLSFATFPQLTTTGSSVFAPSENEK